MTPEQLAEILAQYAAANDISGTGFADLRGIETNLRAWMQTAPSATPADLEQMRAVAAVIDRVSGEITVRTEHDGNVDELRTRYAPAAEVVESVVETPAATVTQAAPAAVTPAAPETPAPAPVTIPDPGATPAPANNAPVVVTAPTPELAFTAAADIPDIAPGATLTLREVADALVARQGHFRGSAPRGEELVPVARLQHTFPIPEAEMGQDPAANQALVASLVRRRLENDEALVAAGGICAPLTPSYDFINISSAARPVRDALMPFRAIRGGMRFLNPISFTTYNSSITEWTNQNDIDAATNSAIRKACLRVDCGAETSVRLEAIVRCMTFGNMNARAFPELVADALAKSMSAHARVGERFLLRQMATNSTRLTHATVLGAYRDVMFALHQVTAAFRNRHRTDPNLPLRVIAPAWLRNELTADLIRQSPGDQTYDTALAEIEGYLTSIAANVTWALDGQPAGGLPAPTASQDYGALAAGVIAAYPNPARLYVFHEGAHVFLDGGSLDLGIVRDSTLNAANDYQVFTETFEGLATVGFDPLVLDLTVCPDGSSSLPIDVAACGSGGS